MKGTSELLYGTQKGITHPRKGKHLNYNERILIEKLLKVGEQGKDWITYKIFRTFELRASGGQKTSDANFHPVDPFDPV